jgi:hypothetical protein
MAHVGQTVSEGSPAPVTGRYEHMARCYNTITVNKGEKMPPCGLAECRNRKASWKLIADLT